ncbi:MAG: ATP-binding protein, partial [Lachnospiraceae bacterium]|nr:ATP-binding protein [Lachnospiraceae bacterium]
VRRMGQVIGNIIVNSYKYANTRIEAVFSLQEEYLQMKISDHGPGVSPEELSLITNKFYRGKQWKESKESGSGLGLYIAKTLMEKMDGELLAESAGEGLSISLVIPLS